MDDTQICRNGKISEAERTRRHALWKTDVEPYPDLGSPNAAEVGAAMLPRIIAKNPALGMGFGKDAPTVSEVAQDMAAIPRRGWIQTFSGDQAWPLQMQRTDINIEDIAHALAMKVRFTGHCTEQYSIAQHSVHVMSLVPEEDQHEALMHDASEYVLPDVATPLKYELANLKAHENNADMVIAKRFNLRFPWPPSVKLADNAMVLFERNKIMNPPKYPNKMLWDVPGEPAYIPDFEVWGWRKAKHEFLAAAARLEIH